MLMADVQTPVRINGIGEPRTDHRHVRGTKCGGMRIQIGYVDLTATGDCMNKRLDQWHLSARARQHDIELDRRG